VNTFFASTTADWRAWLARNRRSEKEVWLIICHKDSGTPSVRYHEAIEHALCYGWIDSQARKRDADSSHLRFTPRNPHSTWSRVNRQRAAEMIELGLMTEHGQALIELAKANGTWEVLPDGESSAILDDPGNVACRPPDSSVGLARQVSTPPAATHSIVSCPPAI